MSTIIKIDHLGKSFQTDNGVVHALDDISLEIQRGEIFGIIGLSGAGKSTLVRCMNYLEKPTLGDIYFEGQSLKAMSEKQIRSIRMEMGMIFQQFNLLAQRNVIQNITFPMEIELAKKEGFQFKSLFGGTRRKEFEKRAKELLELVGISDKALAYPAQLSGGQKQRVAIARAIATNPKVLLCDEATSALDPNTTKQILELIKDINKKLGITVIIITHEMKVIESICDRVAIIDASNIAEVGTVSEVFANPKSKIGRQLIVGDVILKEIVSGGKKLRISFDGRKSTEPVIFNLIMSTKIPINILHASTTDVGGFAMGQMLIQVPSDMEELTKIYTFLDSEQIKYEEVVD